MPVRLAALATKLERTLHGPTTAGRLVTRLLYHALLQQPTRRIAIGCSWAPVQKFLQRAHTRFLSFAASTGVSCSLLARALLPCAASGACSHLGVRLLRLHRNSCRSTLPQGPYQSSPWQLAGFQSVSRFSANRALVNLFFCRSRHDRSVAQNVLLI